MQDHADVAAMDDVGPEDAAERNDVADDDEHGVAFIGSRPVHLSVPPPRSSDRRNNGVRSSLFTPNASAVKNEDLTPKKTGPCGPVVESTLSMCQEETRQERPLTLQLSAAAAKSANASLHAAGIFVN
jgi:hypothetical protein